VSGSASGLRGPGGIRRVAIVAVARKLLIALWRYLETVVVPVDAELKVSKHQASLDGLTGGHSSPR
jgi:hypothetical protein